MSSQRKMRWRGILLIFIASSFWPLYVMAANPVSIVRPERVWAMVFVVVTVGVVLIRLLILAGMPNGPAENTSFIVVMLLMSAGPILRMFGLWAYPLMVLAAILAGWLFVRLEGRVVVAALVWGAAVAVAVGPLAALFESLQVRGPSVVVSGRSIPSGLTETPDIFLVVLDGYPGAVASHQDGLSPGKVDVVAELGERGFEVPESSWSTYWTTTMSIPSLLEMDYPVQRRWEGLATISDLQTIISGDNALVDTLVANGYRTHMVESGWSGGSCGASIDQCVPAPFIDEATYLTLEQTIAWAFLDRSPGPSIEATLAAFDWLAGNGQELSRSPQPDFVFAHVVAPHAPMYLTPECELELNEARGGSFFLLPGVPDEQRAGYMVEQMDCLDRFMVEFSELVEPDDIVVYVSDHGTDRRNQNDPSYTEWDRETTVERLNNFLAVRLPGRCELGAEIVVPNVFRHVLSCIGDLPVEPVTERMWVNPMRELEPEVVQELLSLRADVSASR